MCRNIKTLFNFAPPATEAELHDASLQFVRKLSGFTHPSKANEAVFERSVKQVAKIARSLVDSLETDAAPKDREVEAVRARERSIKRFGERPRATAQPRTDTRPGKTSKQTRVRQPVAR